MIKITLPDNSVKEFKNGTSGLEVAKSISENLAKNAIAVKINETLSDLTQTITKDSKVEIITQKSLESISILRHSTAHVFAQSITRLFKNVKLTIGPAIENGFYYDVDLDELTEEDLKKIEDEMKKIIKENLPIIIEYKTKDEALKFFKKNVYKTEIIEAITSKNLKEEEASEGKLEDGKFKFYKQGEFMDLCTGPHLASTGLIKAFKLEKITKAYWRANAENKQLNRIYGLAFWKTTELEDYVKMIEEAKKRDHRIIGKQLKLFTFCEDIGQGLPIWLPRGNIIKEELEKWAKETEEKNGYQRVTTPMITKENLFYTSEHLPHYIDTMYAPIEIEGEKYYIKPMNCPFHHKTFEALYPSYKDMPIRLAEYGMCHRFEMSGALHGLMRVRGMCMNDAHIYCSKEQAVDEFVDVIKLHQYYYKILGIKEEDYFMELALRDPKNSKYHGDDKMWEEAESLMRKAMEKSGVPYKVENDGAAFYGPKIDFQIKAVTGKAFTASTNQIDLFMPGKFKLFFINKEGAKETPVCIHRAPLGTHERFIGFLIEHFEGKFPIWLSPVQIMIINVADRHIEYCDNIKKKLKNNGFRVECDYSSEGVGKKIAMARENDKPNYMLILGDEDIKNNTVSVRTRKFENGKNEEFVTTIDDFIKNLINERDNREIKY